jgi:hypothetical protein
MPRTYGVDDPVGRAPLRIAGLVLTCGVISACAGGSGGSGADNALAPEARAGGLAQSCNPPENASVYAAEVPKKLQEASYWCWAAAAEMVLAHFSVAAPQCEQANKRFGLTQCCDAAGRKAASPLDAKCDNGGWPQFENYGYTAQQITDKKALTWEQIGQQISCRNQPFAFSWEERGGGGHMMVAVEYQTVGTSRLVCRHNPEADSPTSSFGCIPYDEYDGGKEYTHWNDYYDFIPIQ